MYTKRSLQESSKQHSLHRTARITLTKTMLNQKHPTQRNTYCAVSFMLNSKRGENQAIVFTVSMWLSLRKEEGAVLGACTGSLWIPAVF